LNPPIENKICLHTDCRPSSRSTLSRVETFAVYSSWTEDAEDLSTGT